MMPKKFLCICQGGMVRSAALAWQLKLHGQDVLCASASLNAPSTLLLLWDWADYVVVMTPDALKELPKDVEGKPLWMVDVGEDRYGSPFHYALQQRIYPVVRQWAESGFDLEASGLKAEAA
jgi:hypothetical protein